MSKYSDILFQELSFFLGLYTNLDKIPIFGHCFVLLFMKLSGRNGFWLNIRKTDKHLYKTSVKYQRNYQKLKKAELDLQFLYLCKDNGVCPKFT